MSHLFSQICKETIFFPPLLLLLPSTTARSMRRRKELEAIIMVESSSRPGQGQIRKPLHHQGQYGSKSVQDCHCVLGQTQFEDLTNKEVSPLTFHSLASEQEFQPAQLVPPQLQPPNRQERPPFHLPPPIKEGSPPPPPPPHLSLSTSITMPSGKMAS